MARARLRVVAGRAGGLRLESPAGATTRPTAERVREAVFGSVGPAASGAVVLDLFAGTGAMAIEALSRGAGRAVLVERDRREAGVCGRNLERTGFADAGRVVEGDVVRFLDRTAPAEAPFHLVCCDPPYDTPDAEVDAVLERLAGAGRARRGGAPGRERPHSTGTMATPVLTDVRGYARAPPVDRGLGPHPLTHLSSRPRTHLHFPPPNPSEETTWPPPCARDRSTR